MNGDRWRVRGARNLRDSDGDGIRDGVEIKAGTDPNTPNPMEGVDSDGDGLSDVDEAIYGSDPNDPDTDHQPDRPHCVCLVTVEDV